MNPPSAWPAVCTLVISCEWLVHAAWIQLRSGWHQRLPGERITLGGFSSNCLKRSHACWRKKKKTQTSDRLSYFNPSIYPPHPETPDMSSMLNLITEVVLCCFQLFAGVCPQRRSMAWRPAEQRDAFVHAARRGNFITLNDRLNPTWRWCRQADDTKHQSTLSSPPHFEGQPRFLTVTVGKTRCLLIDRPT